MNSISEKKGSFLLALIFLHISLFSLGYSMMGFTTPLYAYFRGSNQLYLGIIGLLWMTPNIGVPLLLSRSRSMRRIQFLLIITVISVIPIAFFTPFLTRIPQLLLTVVMFGGLQSVWWTAIEMYLGTISGGSQKTITFFSLVWGISFFVAPTLSGYLIDRLGYHAVYTAIAVFFLASLILFMVQLPAGRSYSVIETGNEDEASDEKRVRINYLIFVPSFAAGVIIATITSVFPGYLKSTGISAIAIGYLFSAYASSRIFGFFFLTMASRKVKIKLFFVIGLLLQLFILIPFFTVAYLPLIVMMAIVGLGSGYAFSTPLIYIITNRVRPLARNVAFYEVSLGVSAAATAILSGFIGQNVAVNFPYIASFGLIMVFLAVIVSNYNKL